MREADAEKRRAEALAAEQQAARHLLAALRAEVGALKQQRGQRAEQQTAAAEVCTHVPCHTASERSLACKEHRISSSTHCRTDSLLLGTLAIQAWLLVMSCQSRQHCVGNPCRIHCCLSWCVAALCSECLAGMQARAQAAEEALAAAKAAAEGDRLALQGQVDESRTIVGQWKEAYEKLQSQYEVVQVGPYIQKGRVSLSYCPCFYHIFVWLYSAAQQITA